MQPQRVQENFLSTEMYMKKCVFNLNSGCRTTKQEKISRDECLPFSIQSNIVCHDLYSSFNLLSIFITVL